jgi:anthranilate synthase/aminodeoxychorismate synthase-like glutamine amidotransferase
MVFVLDNYDSFTYNLVQYLGELGQTLDVRRNDQVTLDEIAALRPSHIVISPGPGRPEDAGITPALIERFGPTVPILGVCLGHQAIGLVCGGKIVRAPVPMHGKTSTIDHDGTGVFAGLASPIEASRYHSLIVQEDGLPEELAITARSRGDNVIMGLRHRRWPLVGVQFHPESILTGEGRRMLRNFLDGK